MKLKGKENDESLVSNKTIHVANKIGQHDISKS